MNIQEMIDQTKVLQKRFSSTSQRQWDIQTYLVELIGEVGSLADSIMIKEKFRLIRPGQKNIDLGDDIADIFFILICIADYYSIDISSAYDKMLEISHKKLDLIQKKEL